MQLFFKKGWSFFHTLLFSFGSVVFLIYLFAGLWIDSIPFFFFKFIFLINEILPYSLIGYIFLLNINFIFCFIGPYPILVLLYVIYSLTNETLLIGPEILVLGLFFILISAISLIGASSIDNSLLSTTKGFHRMGSAGATVISGLAKLFVFFFYSGIYKWLDRQVAYSRNTTFIKIVEDYSKFSKFWVKSAKKR